MPRFVSPSWPLLSSMYAYTPAASVTTGGSTPRSRRPRKRAARSPTETRDPNRRRIVLHHAATADETPEPGSRSRTSGTARIRVCLSPPLHTTSPTHAVRWTPPGPNTHSGGALSRDASRSFRLPGHILVLHLCTGVRRLVFESCSVQVYPNIRRTSSDFLEDCRSPIQPLCWGATGTSTNMWAYRIVAAVDGRQFVRVGTGDSPAESRGSCANRIRRGSARSRRA